MVSSWTIVILAGILGTLAHCNAHVPSVGTKIVIAKHKENTENLIDNAPRTEYELAPFISKFIQKGTNVFFKPQFTLSSAPISPPVQTMIVENDEDCVNTPIVSAPILPPPIIMDEPIVPLQVITETPPAPVMIPEAPVLPPLALPVPPVPVVIDCDEKVIESNPLPLVIPEAPILPPLSLPALPLPVLNDCNEKVVISNPPEAMVPYPVIIQEPQVVISEAAALSPLSLPNLPVPVVVEENVECDDKAVEKPLIIPTAPVEMEPIHIPTLPLIFHTLTPQIAVVREKIQRVDRIVIPHLPVLDPITSLPVECIQNIITERVLPNILSQHKFEVVSAVPSYPISSPYLPTLIYK